jgi:hypothetical protein
MCVLLIEAKEPSPCGFSMIVIKSYSKIGIEMADVYGCEGKTWNIQAKNKNFYHFFMNDRLILGCLCVQ